MKHAYLLICLFVCLPLAYGGEATATTAREFNRIQEDYRPNCAYRLQATVVQIMRMYDYVSIVIRDGTDVASVAGSLGKMPNGLQPGDRVEISGTFKNPRKPSFDDLAIKILGHGPAPTPDTLSDDEIRNGRFDKRFVRVRGVIRDVFQDEIDPNWIFFVLNVNDRIVTATCPAYGVSGEPGDYLGMEVEIVGIGATSGSFRRFSGTVILLPDERAIRVIGPRWSDPFLAPALATFDGGIPAQVNGLGRRCVSGTVLAAWQGNTFLLRTDGGQAIAVQVADGPLPAYGDRVTASGIPETDYYRLILARATWRAEKKVGDGEQRVVAQDIKPSELLENEKGEFRVKTTAYGQVIRLVGTVRHLPSASARDRRIFIEADSHLIPIDLSALPELLPQLELGCRVAATGVCILEYEHDSSPGRFPRIRGFAVVPREAGDVRVLSRPSWWTPSRLMTLLGVIFAALAGTVVWNLSLNRRARRKGEELAQEQLARVASELKADERTRLAVELHDSLSQTLTGVSMEIEAANDLRGEAPKPMLDHLGIAAKALKSCRDELKNCLWDLRSQALDDQDMTQAVLRTLQPHVSASRLAVRFNVPRNRLSDNTAHALLRVIRELVVNAIRHGNASVVRVAGAADGDRLLCSVADNGCGFDPATAPGVLQGHFGLQGIRERLGEIGGEFALSSAPGSGTRATITLRLSSEP